VWQRIVETERALRGVVREVYAARFGEAAARKIAEALPERGRESLAHALRTRPAGAEALSVVDYLYLGQLPPLLFAAGVWQDARGRFSGAQDAKQRLQAAVSQIVPIRNEIAHVREVERDRLLPRERSGRRRVGDAARQLISVRDLSQGPSRPFRGNVEFAGGIVDSKE